MNQADTYLPTRSSRCTANIVKTIEGLPQVVRCQRSPHTGTHMAKVGNRTIKWTGPR